MFLHRLAYALLALPRAGKRILALCVDIALCVLTTWLAFYLRLGEWPWPLGAMSPQMSEMRPHHAALLAIVLAAPIFVRYGFYRAIFRYTGATAVRAICMAMLLYGALFAAIILLVGLPGIPRTIGIIQPLTLFVAVTLSRLLARYWLGGLYIRQSARAVLPKVLVYGAGDAGRRLTEALAHNIEMRVIGFLDDDVSLHGHTLNHLPVYNPARLPELVGRLEIRAVLLAMPRLERARRNEILARMAAVHVAVRSLPSLTELAQGKAGIADLHEPDIDDLLGRAPVAPDPQLLSRNITGKVVLVTGAGGSIGSELCRQILTLAPAALLLLEQSEFALYRIHHALVAQYGETMRIVPLLGSVCDAARLAEIMSAFPVKTIYHAAAYKHVPLVEDNPAEGLKNNVLGTLIAAQAALAHGVADFVLISTDKAVRPTSVMGASKRLAEMVLQALAARKDLQGGIRFCMVRFGNVLGSSGSVVPRFRQQIRAGGPITLTHPEVSRYFMSIPEAAQLVIQAGSMASQGQGGDVFVLDMGEPVKILHLAQRMVALSGLSVQDAAHPDGDIRIDVTGLRPGEKLHEELLISDNPERTAHPRIMRARERFLPWSELETHLAHLQVALDARDIPRLRQLLAITGIHNPDATAGAPRSQ
ncbi:MAG: polysaccharide biosynthesis protein [Zoogloeaceae bacterium]|jgi:FlaA1/EpsC-like NDP-sugar epimerase|nr:polysaccharide biosynthesis protein [Zoogloeaceae bacterium]